ncbi:MAG: hypothetical protein IJ704_05960 [Bacilli bacterium]|nr:hypothetical protein [Bacilli bacterium]
MDNYICFKRQQYFYVIYDNDALIMQKIFGLKVSDSGRFKTGIPIIYSERYFSKLDELHINYVVLSGDKIKIKKEFADSKYENLLPKDYSPTVSSLLSRASLKNKGLALDFYKGIDILKGLVNEVNIFTAEKITGIDKDLKVYLAKFIKMLEDDCNKPHTYFKKRYWTEDEKKYLIEEYNSHQKISIIARKLGRSTSSVKQKLKLLLNNKE